jgi:hypothetical protein
MKGNIVTLYESTRGSFEDNCQTLIDDGFKMMSACCDGVHWKAVFYKEPKSQKDAEQKKYPVYFIGKWPEPTEKEEWDASKAIKSCERKTCLSCTESSTCAAYIRKCKMIKERD